MTWFFPFFLRKSRILVLFPPLFFGAFRMNENFLVFFPPPPPASLLPLFLGSPLFFSR